MTVTMLENGYVLVPRADWGAKYRAGNITMRPLRSKVFIHHTVTPATSDPCGDMRLVERVLNSRKLAPGYSFTVHPTGTILEGAGKMVGAHTAGHNSEGYAFSFIGNMDKEHPTMPALVNVARTINIMRMTGQLVPDLAQIQILAHRDVKATACPGSNMVNKNINGKSALEWIRWFAEQGA